MRALMIAAALAFAAAAPLAQAQTADQSQAAGKGRTARIDAQCHGPDGKHSTNAKCKGAGPAPAASSIFKRDSKGQCRDENGRLAKDADCKLPS